MKKLYLLHNNDLRNLCESSIIVVIMITVDNYYSLKDRQAECADASL